MTAVIGILNKKGVAIAADSAVTISSRDKDHFDGKCINNGNKMLRLSDAVPISIMTTGNLSFLFNPWEVIIRRYRQQRGHIAHPTVEKCIIDFFNYMSRLQPLWNIDTQMELVERIADSLFTDTVKSIQSDILTIEDSKNTDKQKSFISNAIQQFQKVQEELLKNGTSPHFEDYTGKEFHTFVGENIREFLAKQHFEGTDGSIISYPDEIINGIIDEFEKTLMIKMTTKWEDHYTELVITGFGAEEEYPTLVPVTVCDGFGNRVNYHIDPKDIIHISDEHPVAICRFAQADIVDSILLGIHWDCFLSYFKLTDSINDANIFGIDKDNPEDIEFKKELDKVNSKVIHRRIINKLLHLRSKNRTQWEKLLIDYDLKSMAALAESLIDLTGFHRILTFQQESVGGDVDLAVISKNEGFTWLNRKSWYHHKDVNGQYGRFGV